MADRTRGITIEIGGDTTGLDKALKNVNREISSSKSELKDIEKLLKLDPSNTELMAQKQRALSDAVSSTREKLDALKEAQRQAAEQLANGNMGQEQYDALQREIIETENQLRNLETQAAQSSVALQQIGAAGETLKNVGSKIEGVGQKLLPVTGAVTALGTAAVKTASDFDSAMSQVAAVSGATGDDLEALRDKAREMGSKTKFSASEAAAAMNYMAMAGWKTADMLGGIEGIMNLAAASGEELATTSDIVTDALTAFGQQTDQSGRLADILAAASSNANTNVSMLGESFKYVAPVAGALGFTMEDTSVALSLMANAGIKGSQAGTSLRTALTNLVKPSTNMAKGISRMGIEITNADGSMKSLREIMDMLREKMKNMTEEEKKATMETLFSGSEIAAQAMEGLTEEEIKATTALRLGEEEIEKQNLGLGDLKVNLEALGYSKGDIKAMSEEEIRMAAATDIGTRALQGMTAADQAATSARIFGKESMSGMLAIINASEADYNKLTNAIDNSEGSAEKMAATMQDNLEGQFTILKSQLEELSISFGEILMPAIRQIVTYIQGFVDKLNSMDDETRKTIVTVALFAAALGPVLIIVGKVISAVGTIMTIIPKVAGAINTVKTAFMALNTTMLANPIFLIIAAITALVAAFIYLWNTNEGFRDFWIDLWEKVSEFFTKVWDGIIKFLTETIPSAWNSVIAFFEGIPAWWENLWNGIANYFSEIWNAILGNPIVSTIINTITLLWTNAVNTIQSIWNGLKDIASATWELIKNTILGPVLLLIDLITGDFDKFAEDAIKIWENIKQAASTIWNGLKQVVGAIVTGFVTHVVTLFAGLLTTASNIWTKIKNTASEIWEKIKTYVITKAKQMKDDAITAFKNMVTDIGRKLMSLPQKVKDGFKGAVDYLKGLPDKALEWGKDFIDGFKKGLQEKITAVVDKIKGLGEKIRELLHFSRPDKGPLRDYETWMPDFMSGLAEGIKNSQHLVTDAMTGLAGNMTIATEGISLTGEGYSITGIDDMCKIMRQYLPYLAAGTNIRLETGELVGVLAPSLNSEFGKIAIREAQR